MSKTPTAEQLKSLEPLIDSAIDAVKAVRDADKASDEIRKRGAESIREYALRKVVTRLKDIGVTPHSTAIASVLSTACDLLDRGTGKADKNYKAITSGTFLVECLNFFADRKFKN